MKYARKTSTGTWDVEAVESVGYQSYVAGFYSSISVDASDHFVTWNDNDIQDSTHGLKSLTYSDFEVVNLTPSVTGLSATSGSAGSTVTDVIVTSW